MPLVSILMPVRDGARFLDAAVGSVFAGGFDDFELIAIDDGSVDDSAAILTAWAARDVRLRVIRLERSAGGAAALNRGLEQCSGEFATPLDQDDLFVAESVGPRVAALRADPRAALVAGGSEVIDKRGRLLFTRRYAEAPEVTAHLLTLKNPLTHGSAMYRSADARAVGGYTARIQRSYDYDLWLRLLARGHVRSLATVCARYRWHGEQATVRFAAEQQEESLANSRRRLTEVLGREPGAVATEAALNVARETGRIVDFAAADCLLQELLRLAPSTSHGRISRLTAELWVNHASRLALGGHVPAALTCLRFATRWDPRAVAPLVGRRIAWFAAVRYRERT